MEYTQAIAADSVAVKTPLKIPPIMIIGTKNAGIASKAIFTASFRVFLPEASFISGCLLI